MKNFVLDLIFGFTIFAFTWYITENRVKDSMCMELAEYHHTLAYHDFKQRGLCEKDGK